MGLAGRVAWLRERASSGLTTAAAAAAHRSGSISGSTSSSSVGGGCGSACPSNQAAALLSTSAASAASATHSSNAEPPAPAFPKKGPLLEIREYWLHPAGVKPFLALSAETAGLRRSLLPLVGFWSPDTGAGDLNRVVHLYAYESLEARDAARAAAARHQGWQRYIDAARPHVQRQASRIMVEAAGVYAAVGAPGAAGFDAHHGDGDGAAAGGGAAADASSGRGSGGGGGGSNASAGVSSSSKGLYELREYQLSPGYGSVPRLYEAFERGLPAKIAAGPEGRLVALAHSDVGVLNNVVELWRYPGAAACARARQASRGVPEWRETIAAVAPGVQTFTSTFLTPCSFSPLQ